MQNGAFFIVGRNCAFFRTRDGLLHFKKIEKRTNVFGARTQQRYERRSSMSRGLLMKKLSKRKNGEENL